MAMLDVHVPDLRFPGVKFGPHETPWDLRPWLYKGGAEVHAKEVAPLIEAGKLGRPLLERIELVLLLRENLLNYLEGGGRRATVQSCLSKLKLFFQWADETGSNLSLATAERNYRHWCDSLLHRVRVVRDLKEISAHQYGSRVGWALDKVLERSSPLLKTTRLIKPKAPPRAVSPKADKQNLEETFAFGHFLLDLSDALSVDAIWGPLPLQIRLRNGNSMEEWSGLKRSHTLKPPNAKWPSKAKIAAQNRAAWQAEKSYRTRYSLINLRIMAEMFMLMGQPAVNLAQAHQLRMDQLRADEWRYKSCDHGYEIRTYKHRRWGPVIFKIYGGYRAVLERYLQWRKDIFPGDPEGLLFPLLGKGGSPARRRLDEPPSFVSLNDACKRAGVKFIGPQALRNTNVNWMLRRTGDPDLTADEKQHDKQTLLGVYEKPSLQRAMIQTQVFWAKYDPALAPLGPGSCAGKAPEPVADTPPTATQPDCTTPSGCLFCVHQRDIDSLDHVWSLASFRLLKSFELGARGHAESKNLSQHPSDLAIERITAKLDFIRASTPERAEWVKEALLRLEEGRYHPAWADFIESL